MSLIADSNEAGLEAVDRPLLEMLLKVSKSLRALSGYMLADIGLYPGQDEMLIALTGSRRTSTSAIAGILGIRPSTVSKMTDRLVEAGFVSRQRDPYDKRATSIVLTVSGTMVREKAIVLHEKFETDFVQAFASTGAEDIQMALARIEIILERRLSRLR